MKKLSLRGFYRFIKNQPASKRIKHDNGWCGCAVGDYIRYARKNRNVDGTFSFTENKLPRYLFNALNFEGASRRELSTYGKLATFISKSGRV